jgi:hypothetical protein
MPAHAIEVHVAELRQLFNAMDPAPFQERDLDPAAEEYIASWARELPRNESVELVVHLDRPEGSPDECDVLTRAIHQFFNGRALAMRRQFRQLMQRGRVSLVIGLAFLGLSLAVSNYVSAWLPDARISALLHESFLIGGWVAMWRPLEIFLYDWWPIRAEGKLLARLASMPVGIRYAAGKPDDAWRLDWPAAPMNPRGQAGA